MDLRAIQAAPRLSICLIRLHKSLGIISILRKVALIFTASYIDFVCFKKIINHCLVCLMFFYLLVRFSLVWIRTCIHAHTHTHFCSWLIRDSTLSVDLLIFRVSTIRLVLMRFLFLFYWFRLFIVNVFFYHLLIRSGRLLCLIIDSRH